METIHLCILAHTQHYQDHKCYLQTANMKFSVSCISESLPKSFHSVLYSYKMENSLPSFMITAILHYPLPLHS